MAKTVNMTLRIPPDLAAAVDYAARQRNTSRHQFIVDTLVDEVGYDSGLVLGYWQVFSSEVDTECPECGQNLTETWLGVTAAGRVFGPVCGLCATTK